MGGADSSQENFSVPGQSTGAGNRLAENICYFLVGKFLMWPSEQH
jgi:hypothetical protein